MMKNNLYLASLPSPVEEFLDRTRSFMKSTFGKVKAGNRYVSIVNDISVSDHAFLTDGGGYVTYIRYGGQATAPLSSSVINTMTEFSLHLKDFLKEGHRIHDSFISYKDGIPQKIRHLKNGRMETARLLGLSAYEKDEALIQHIKESVFFEGHIIALETPAMPNLYRASSSSLKKSLPSIPLSEQYSSSVDDGNVDQLLSVHQEFVDRFLAFVSHGDVKVDAQLLKHSQALHEIMAFTDSQSAGTDMEAIAGPNLSVNEGFSDTINNQIDEIFAKDFEGAIFKDTPHRHATRPNIVVVGERMYMNIIIDNYSSAFRNFNELHLSLCKSNTPYMVKTSIGGDPVRDLKALYSASKLSFTPNGSPGQRAYKAGFKKLEEFSKDDTAVFVQQVFSTWVDGLDNVDKLVIQCEEMLSLIKAWSLAESNRAHIDEVTPLQSFYTALPCCTRSTATKIPLPFIDTLTRMPFYRPCWPYGAKGDLVTVSPDGKVMPYDQLGGRIAYITLVLGQMGAGKSVYLMHLRDLMIMRQGNTDLPFQFSIDVGGSTEYDTDLLRSENPQNKDKIAYIRMNNDKNNSAAPCINLFDTPLGLRKLPPAFEDAIVNLLVDRIQGPKQDLTEVKQMTSEVVRGAYRRCASNSRAKKIKLSTVPSLHTALAKHGFIAEDQIDDDVRTQTEYTGWDIVEFLILREEFQLAYQVQTHCVPRFEDLIAIANQNEFKIKYESENRGDNFRRRLIALADDYPFISRPSNFTIWDKHIVNFELGDVVTKNGNSDDAYNSRFWFSLVFLYVRGILAVESKDADRYVSQIENENELRGGDENYQWQISQKISGYHKRRISLIANSKKRIQVDELHRFLGDDPENSANSYASQILSSLINEIRRSGIEMIFASPMVAHGHLFKGVATMIVLLGFASDVERKKAESAFSLTEEEVRRYVKPLRLDPKRGINGYVILRDIREISNVDEFRHPIYVPIPTIEIWRYANRFSERYIRERLIELFGVNQALILLCGALPNAGNSKDLSILEDQLRREGAFDTFDMSDSEDQKRMQSMVADKIVEKIANNTDYYQKEGERRIFGDSKRT